MAKKSNKKSKTLLLAISCLATALGIVAIFLPFADFIKLTFYSEIGNTYTTAQGFNFIFGENSNTGSTIAWVLVLVGSIISLLSFILGALTDKGKGVSLLLFLGSLCLIVGGVMYFFFIQMAGLENYETSIGGWTYSLEISAILGGICGCLGGLVGLCGSISTILKH